MIWSFLKFASMMSGILVAIHWFIYVSFLRFIPVLQATTYRRVLYLAILALGFSFPVFMILNHFWGSAITRFLNGVAGLWFALALYLVMIFSALWLLLQAMRLGQTPADIINSVGQNVAIVFSLGALLFTLYGFINALSVKTTIIDVAIQNLPPSWNGKTIMQVSDVHLGAVWGPDRMEQITKIAYETKPEIIVMTGDLFDGSSGKHEEFIKSLSDLAKTNPPGGIYFTSGNHERYTNYEDSINAIKKANIRLLENDVVNIHGLQLIGIQYPDLRKPANSEQYEKTPEFHLQAHPGYKKGRPSVLLYHTPTDFLDGKFDLGDIQRKAYINPQTNFDNAQSLGIDLQLSGHTHAGQFSPFIWITKILYHGYHYGLHRVGKFQIYISSGAGTWGPPIRHDIPNEIALLKLHRE